MFIPTSILVCVAICFVVRLVCDMLQSGLDRQAELDRRKRIEDQYDREIRWNLRKEGKA